MPGKLTCVCMYIYSGKTFLEVYYKVSNFKLGQFYVLSIKYLYDP